MIYHFENDNFQNIFDEDGFPKIHHISFLELKDNTSYQAMHAHKDRVEIIYLLSGKGEHMIGKHRYFTDAGDLLVINAGVLHEERARGAETLKFCCCAVTNLKFKGKKEGELVGREQLPVISVGKQKEVLLGLFQMIQRESYEENFFKGITCSLLASVIVLKTFELISNSQCKGIDQTKEHWLVEKVQEYLDCNYQNKITLQNMADFAAVSPWYLDRIFKKYTGASPTQYLIHRKLGYAQSLFTDTEESIAKIAEKIGYDNPSYFSQLFKKKFGMTPGEYRKKLKKETGRKSKEVQENNILKLREIGDVQKKHAK